MLLNGESLMQKDYKNWPKDLPVLIVHGTGDTVSLISSHSYSNSY
jgi:acylglycerol lipase